MKWNDLDARWQEYFIRELHNAAYMSKDADTKVGSIIVDARRKKVKAKGYNDLPRGVKHLPERNQRPLKYLFTVHAEKNAHYDALYEGVSIDGMIQLSTLYACSQCAGGVIQAGISEFVCPEPDWNYPSLKDDFPVTQRMFYEAGVITTYDERLKYV